MDEHEQDRAPNGDRQAGMDSGRLETWGEIGKYLGRSERTLRRWEQTEGLPVHRLLHDQRGSVYAYTNELDRWRASRSTTSNGNIAEATPPVRKPTGRRGGWALAAGIILALGALFTGTRNGESDSPNEIASDDLVPEWRQYTTSEEAWMAYSRGLRYCDNHSTSSLHSGIEQFQLAISLDPAFARAHASLAITWIAIASFGELGGTEAIERARNSASRAREIDPESGGAVLAEALAHWFEFDPDRALRMLAPFALRPTSGITPHVYAEILMDQRRFTEADVYLEQARSNQPKSLYVETVRGNRHYFAGNLQMAMLHYDEAVRQDPNFGFARFYRARALLDHGRTSAAVKEMERAALLLESNPFSDSGLAYVLARAGQEDRARRMLDEMIRRREADGYPAIAIATVYMGLGDTEAAWSALEDAVDEQLMFWYTPHSEPLFAPLWSDPRFPDFVRRLGIPEGAIGG